MRATADSEYDDRDQHPQTHGPKYTMDDPLGAPGGDSTIKDRGRCFGQRECRNVENICAIHSLDCRHG